MADAIPAEPITLSRWPSCNDCLVSSEDELAVACGENIHFLRIANNDHSPDLSWHVATTRVNQFIESEWPTQTLAPTKYLSIGEEQSESIVVSLAWSPPGLGLHKRAVLAVLTSNLVLSLWESDGSPGRYQRTCIVNQYLSTHTNELLTEESRRACRIRAFAWIPILDRDTRFRNRPFFLAIADDDSLIQVFQVTKSSAASFGHFALASVANLSLKHLDLSTAIPMAISPLQQNLYHESTISRIDVAEWQSELLLGSGNRQRTCSLQLCKGPIQCDLLLAVSLRSVSGSDDPTAADAPEHDNSFSLRAIGGPQLRDFQSETKIHKNAQDVDPSILFKSAVKSLAKAFDEEHNLFGHYKVRWWGTCRALSTDKMVACVTLHPLDMVEHTQPSVEKSTLIFATTSMHNTKAARPVASPAMAQERIINYAVSKVQELPLTVSNLDMKTISVLTGLARQLTGMVFQAQELATASNSRSVHETNGDTGDLVPNEKQDTIEACTFCSAAIPFSSDTSSARCLSGHLFTRCNLTFLAIQEPGISKYCSGCDKQFLHQAKLNFRPGPSLVQALFDEFDVCPYCNAKFRG